MPATHSEHAPGFLIAAIGAGVAGTAMFNLAPLFLSAAMEAFRLDDRQIGLLIGTEIAGISLASLAGVLLAPRLGCRTLAISGLMFIVLGNITALAAQDYSILLAIRFLTGFGGDGLAYVAAIIALGHWHNPTRAFALYSFTNMCIAGTTLALLPRLPGAADWQSITLLLAGLAVVALLLSRQHLTGLTGKSAGGITGVSPLVTPANGLLLTGLFAYTVNLGAVWGYVERIGDSAGLDTVRIGLYLGISMAFQALGSLSAAGLSRYTGAVPPLFGTLVLQLAALYLLAGVTDGTGFLVAVALWGFSWNLGIANILGLVAGLPGGRRLLALAPGTEALGASLGPVIVALLLVPGDYSTVIMIAAISLLAGIGLITTIAFNRQAPAGYYRIPDTREPE